MRIGLWSDCHNFPSLPLMKLSAYHKAIGDEVELFDYWHGYDLVYASKTFSFTDYNLFPQYDYAVGFLTRGCPRNCGFCVVGKKEGLQSCQVADLTEFWRGQSEIKLLDPNLLACKEHEALLQHLTESKATIDFTQGLDIRLINPDNIRLLNSVKTKGLHFAWDNPKQDLTEHFKHLAELTNIRRDKIIVYVLTNFNSTLDEDLFRIYTLRSLGLMPYVMIYRKDTAPKQVRRLQRWVNCRKIFRSVEKFDDYK